MNDQFEHGVVKVGHKLHAFAQDKATHLRSVRGGRQALSRFALQYPTTGEIEYPSEWTKDPKAAGRVLEKWLKIPGNPFNPPNEAELETPSQEHERRGPPNRTEPPNGTEPPNEGELGEPDGAILIGPSSLRTRRRNNQDLDELKESLKHVLAQVSELKEQNGKILTQNEEIKAQNERIRTQNEEIKVQYEEIKVSYASLQATLTTTPARGTPAPTTPTWAGVAAQGTHISQDQNTPRITGTPRQNQTRAPGIEVDLSGMTDPHFDVSSAKAIRERTRQAFNNHPMTKEIKRIGIEMKSAEQRKIRICLSTQKDADTAKIHNEWLHSHFPGARIVGDQWYPIKVDKVCISSICNDSNVQFKEDACEKISRENGINVKKIRFLRRPSPDKAYCSIVLYLRDKEDAERMLDQKSMDFDGEAAYTKVFVSVPTPMRCFNCHKLDSHEARRCPAREPVCGTCSGTGHIDQECTASTPRCVNCGGSHKASDRGCPEYKKRLERLNKTNHE